VWLKVWTIGNGGIPSGCWFHQVPDGYDDEIIFEILDLFLLFILISKFYNL